MKKIILGMILAVMISTSASAASLFVTTINNVSSDKVQDTLITAFTDKNFTIGEVTPYTVTFQKSFGDGFWTATKLDVVKCNIVVRNENVKVMVSEMETIAGQVLRQRGIDHIVPIISEVKHSLDGTPVEEIKNEAVNQLPDANNTQDKTKSN